MGDEMGVSLTPSNRSFAKPPQLSTRYDVSGDGFLDMEEMSGVAFRYCS